MPPRPRARPLDTNTADGAADGATDPEAGLAGLSGIGPRREAAYATLGVVTRRQLLYHLPSRFRVRDPGVSVEELEAGGRGAVVGTVKSTSLRRRGPRSTVTVRLRPDGAERDVAALIFNRAWLSRSLKAGMRLWVSGRVELDQSARPPAPRLRILVADHELLADGATGISTTLLPLYSLPAGVPPRVHRRALATVLDTLPLDDWRVSFRCAHLPSAVRERMGPLADQPLAVVLDAIHRPTDLERARCARARLAFDEAFSASLGVAARRLAEGTVSLRPWIVDDAQHRSLLARLPFTPTGAQARVLEELRRDLARGAPMNRLLQGDVGSGKTLVALWLMLAAHAAGRQAALMAPTEVLAEQHLASLERWLAAADGPGAPRVALVTGGRTPAFRREQRALVADGTAALAVGTHGLQSAPVRFADLAVTIVDEQHRFGVAQRSRFRRKGDHSHLLVMTATPIPRTLALTAYGELDVSILDELPPGRSPRRTALVPPAKQAALWKHVRQAVAAGERGYVVCPSIGLAPSESDGSAATDVAWDLSPEDDEDVDHSVMATLQRVQAVLGEGVTVAPVHGRLPADERDAVLDAFRAGEVDVLVATVLVEVGLDVPQATFVVVPDPARFGLATLHQIRGRVGRGSRPGSCWLMGPLRTRPARARAAALCESEDGFVLAEKDLELRGAGELLGTRQSGLPRFAVLDPVADVALLAAAREEALRMAGTLDAEVLADLRHLAFPLRNPAFPLRNLAFPLSEAGGGGWLAGG